MYICSRLPGPNMDKKLYVGGAILCIYALGYRNHLPYMFMTIGSKMDKKLNFVGGATLCIYALGYQGPRWIRSCIS